MISTERMSRYLAIVAALSVLAPPAVSVAQDPEATADEIELMTGTADPKDKKKKRTSRRPKVRDGSWLKKNQPMPEVEEQRGSYEAVLDTELAKHFRRLAVLDRIIEVAAANNDDGLAGRADAVRRKEVSRFRQAMTDFRNQAQARRIVGFP